MQRFIKILRAFQRKDITKSLALKCIVLTNDLENKTAIVQSKSMGLGLPTIYDVNSNHHEAFIQSRDAKNGLYKEFGFDTPIPSPNRREV